LGDEGGVGGVAHVGAFDEYLGDGGQVGSGQVVAWLDAVDAVVGADRLPGSRGEGGPQVGGQAVGGSDDRVVDAVSNWFEDGEAASAGWPAVGV